MNDQTMSTVSDVSFYYIPQIETALKDKDLDGAERLLEEAQQLIKPRSPVSVRLRVLRNEAQRQRRAQITELEKAIRKALTEPMDVATAEEKLDELARLQPEHPCIPEWWESLADERARRRANVKVQEVGAELKRRWKAADEAEQAGCYGMSLLAFYEDAREYAKREAGNLKDPWLAGLAQRAENIYNRKRQAYGGMTTLQVTGRYKELIERVRHMAPTERVMISRDLHDIEGTHDRLPATEAIRLLESQARDYAAEKAAQYRDNALRYLGEHAPAAAEQELRKALDLFGLDEEERRKTDALLESRVMPALELRSQALELLRRAESQADPVEAWNLFSKARNADPYAPALTEVHALLAERINRYLSSGFAAAQRGMTGSGRPEWRRAQDIAKNMRELAIGDMAFESHLEVADAILAEAADWRQLESEINAAIAEAGLKRATDPRFAYDSLLARKAGWGERASRFPELDAFLQSLEARLTWNERIALARSLITDARDKETLVKATNALQDALRLEPNAGETQLLLSQAEARARWLDQVSELKTRAKLALEVSNLDTALDSLQQLRALDPSDAEVTTLLEQARQQMASRSIEEELPSLNQMNQRSTWNLTTVLALVCLGAGILVAILASLFRAPTGLLIAMALVLAGAALYLISLLRSATA